MTRATSTSGNQGIFVFIAALTLSLVAFGPAINAPFDFDDRGAIIANTTIRQAWPPTALLRMPGNGTAVSGRPLANYSFALNSAVNRWLGVSGGAYETTGYHVLNIVIQALSALLLFLIIRDTLRAARLLEEWRPRSEAVAAITAAIWLIHPIQTEPVNYISQRTELLVSTFYLATIYGAQRAFSEKGWHWALFTVVACTLGMASKEVMITAPVMVILYDRAFLLPSWSSIWQSTRRCWLYAGLFASAILLVALVALGGRGGTVGFDLGIPWYRYLYAQASAIPRYIELLFWPHRLAYDYGRNPFADNQAIGALIILAIVGIVTVFASFIDRWRPISFLGAWFYLILAPSSSIIPIRTEIAAERRVHLASASVILLVVGLLTTPRRGRSRAIVLGAIAVGYFLAVGWTASEVAPDRLPAQLGVRLLIALAIAGISWCCMFARPTSIRIAAASLVGLALLGRTWSRSSMYRTPELLWADAAHVVPTNGRAYSELARFQLKAIPPQLRQADSLYGKATEFDSTLIQPWRGRAIVAVQEGRVGDAELMLRQVLQLAPRDSSATDGLGTLLIASNRPDQAIPYLTTIATQWPTAETLSNLGAAYEVIGRLDSAREVFIRALAIDATSLKAVGGLGTTLVQLGDVKNAIPYLKQSAEFEPTSGTPLGLLAMAYARSGEPQLAASAAAAATGREPNNPRVQEFAGLAMVAAGLKGDAVTYLREAARLDPNNPEALTRLAEVLASLGRNDESVALLRRALAIAPNYSAAQQALVRLRH